MLKYARCVAKNKLSTFVKSAVEIYVSNVLNPTSYSVSNALGESKNLLGRLIELER